MKHVSKKKQKERRNRGDRRDKEFELMKRQKWLEDLDGLKREVRRR